jgi:hypothetical protein
MHRLRAEPAERHLLARLRRLRLCLPRPLPGSLAREAMGLPGRRERMGRRHAPSRLRGLRRCEQTALVTAQGESRACRRSLLHLSPRRAPGSAHALASLRDASFLTTRRSSPPTCSSARPVFFLLVRFVRAVPSPEDGSLLRSRLFARTRFAAGILPTHLYLATACHYVPHRSHISSSMREDEQTAASAIHSFGEEPQHLGAVGRKVERHGSPQARLKNFPQNIYMCQWLVQAGARDVSGCDRPSSHLHLSGKSES